MVRWCWVNFQFLGVLLIWIIVGQRPTVLSVGAGGGLDIFSLIYHFSSFSLSLGDGLIYTEILSQRAVKPKNNQQLLQFTNSLVLVILHVTKNGHCNRAVTAILRRMAITIRYCIKSCAERY